MHCRRIRREVLNCRFLPYQASLQYNKENPYIRIPRPLLTSNHSVTAKDLPAMYPKKVSFVFLVILSLLLGCNLFDSNEDTINRTDRRAEASFSYNIPITGQTVFRIEAVNGSITMGGSSTENVVISGVKAVGSETIEDAEERLADLEIRVSEGGNTIQVETIQPENTRGRSYTVDYEITLPGNLESVVLQVNGTVFIEGMRADLETELVNGEVELQDIEGSVAVSVVNGNILSEVALPAGGTLAQSIVNGEIELSIPDTTSADFSASINNGNISLSGLTLENQSITSRTVTGTLGNGNGTINLQVVNGEILVRGRD